MRGGGVVGALGLVLGVMMASTAASEASTDFPFGKELLLDSRPMKGSKRIPILDIHDNGTAAIDLWCNSVRAQFVVVNDTVTVMTGEPTNRTCPPERAQGDQDMMDALTQVTNWRREGDSLVLIGPRTLRFRLQSN
jgi:heat shock protein HslJ